MKTAITSDLVNAANKEAREVSQLEVLDKIHIPTEPFEDDRPKMYNIIFKLVKKKKGRIWLDNCCRNVPNPNNNNIPERIWYLDGAHSIWDRDLEYIFKDKNRYDRSRRGMDIVFVDGVCRVKSTDVLLLEFMRMNTHNVGKRRTGTLPSDFYEYDPQEEQKERAAKQMLQIEMILKVKDMKEDKVRPLASFFMGRDAFVDELGQPKSLEGMRTDLMLKAQADPASFQKYMDSTEVAVSYLIRKAITDNKIDLGGVERNVTWAQSRGFISKVPVNRKPLEYLTELAMTNSEDGRTFRQQLEKIVN